MSFVSNGGKFKIYTVLGLIFPTPTQTRILFESAIYDKTVDAPQFFFFNILISLKLNVIGEI
jgi:hypothetical protein